MSTNDNTPDLGVNNLVDLQAEINNQTRIYKHKSVSDFTHIHNHAIKNPKVGTNELAILLYLMSKPADWYVLVEDVSKRFDKNRKTISGYINNLMALGYIRRYQERRPNGTKGLWITEVADTDIFLTEDQSAETIAAQGIQPVVEKRSPVKTSQIHRSPFLPLAVKLPTTNKRNNSNKRDIVISTIGNRAKAPVDNPGRPTVPNVGMTHTSLVAAVDHLADREIQSIKRKLAAMRKDGEIPELIARKSHDQLVAEVVFHVENRNRAKHDVKHAINGAAKLIRDAKWGTPKEMVRLQEEALESNRKRRIEEEVVALRDNPIAQILGEVTAWKK